MEITIPEHIEIYLENDDLVPYTEPRFIEGIPGKLHILGAEDLAALRELVELIESIPEREWIGWDAKTKWYYSSMLNAAERALTHCVIVPQIPSVIKNFAEKFKKNRKKNEEARSI